MTRQPRFSLTNWPIYAAKTGIAAALALLACAAVGLHDRISTVFLAVIATSPTVLTGLERTGQQLIASLLGGAVATAVLAVTAQPALAIGLAIAGAVFLAGRHLPAPAHLVAAFTALYVVILSGGSPEQGVTTRLIGLATGGAAATLTNFLASTLFYRPLFARRMLICQQAVAALRADPQVPVQAVLRLLSEMRDELSHGLAESWLVPARTRLQLAAYRDEIDRHLGELLPPHPAAAAACARH